jgi:hypothetical protein
MQATFFHIHRVQYPLSIIGIMATSSEHSVRHSHPHETLVTHNTTRRGAVLCTPEFDTTHISNESLHEHNGCQVPLLSPPFVQHRDITSAGLCA